jgi:hypothetical protein
VLGGPPPPPTSAKIARDCLSLIGEEVLPHKLLRSPHSNVAVRWTLEYAQATLQHPANGLLANVVRNVREARLRASAGSGTRGPRKPTVRKMFAGGNLFPTEIVALFDFVHMKLSH